MYFPSFVPIKFKQDWKTTCHLQPQLPQIHPPWPRPCWQATREKCVINDRGLVISAGWLTDPTAWLHRSQSTHSLISTHYYCGHTSNGSRFTPNIILTGNVDKSKIEQNEDFLKQQKLLFALEPMMWFCRYLFSSWIWPRLDRKHIWQRQRGFEDQ